MRVLVVGAGGFIGAHISARLWTAGHDVVAGVRDVGPVARRLSFCSVIKIDVEDKVDEESWSAPLHDIDAVIYCAGLLQASAERLDVVHHRAPAALFRACENAGVQRVIYVSAVSANEAAGTEYARSKLRGEQALQGRDLDWVVVRPSLVWSPVGSYGGTSALRGIAAVPGIVPVLGQGDQLFTPITVDDLAGFIVSLLGSREIRRVSIEPCGPETLSFRDIVVLHRRWLGLSDAPIVAVPRAVGRAACAIGDVLRLGPISTTALLQIEHGNAADSARFESIAGFRPTSMTQALAAHPAQEQDRWHARLYFAEPALRLALAVLWLVSGIAGLMADRAVILELAAIPGIPDSALLAAGRAASVVDIAIAAALILRWHIGRVAALQLLLVAAYTVVLTLLNPGLWLDPLGPLLKNIPIALCIAFHSALAARR